MKLDEAVKIDDGIRRFVEWALKTLKFSLAASDGDELTFDIPDSLKSFFRLIISWLSDTVKGTNRSPTEMLS